MEPKKKKSVSLALNSETLPAENPNDTKANHLSTAKENVKWVPTPPKLELKSSASIERSPTPTSRAKSSSRSPSPISTNDAIATSRGFTGFTFTNVPLGFNIRELVIREPGFIKLLYKPSLRTSNDSSVDIFFSSESSAKSAKTLLGRLFASSILPEQTLLRSDTLENATSQTKSSTAASTVLKFKNSESKNSPVLLIESRIHQLLSCFDGFIGLFYGSMTVYIKFASIGQATVAYTALLSTTNLNIRYSNEGEMENAIKLAEQNAGKMQRSKGLTAAVENGTTTVIGEAPSTKKVDLTQPIATTSNGAVASLTTAPESSNAVKRVKTFDSSGRAISPSPSETVSMDNQKHKSKKKPTAATPSPEPTSASTTTQPATVTDVLKIFRVGDGNKKLLIPVGQATEAGKMCNGFISAG
ncbi:hypothetical protein BDR26DRAFT_514175 [Obelidium mucronatum]|nr:hypothetical protein BDR26DRAFT_514175 [Obelidium mucronatum]